MTSEIYRHCLQRSEARYRQLQAEQTEMLLADKDVSAKREQILFYAAEICELRHRLAGGVPNLCY